MSDKSDKMFRIVMGTTMVLFFAFVLFFCFLMGSAQAEEASKTYYVTGNHVRIRIEPNTDARIVGHLDKGDQVQVTCVVDGWARLIDYNYVSMEFLTEDEPLPTNKELFILGPGVRERSTPDTSSDSNVVCRHQAGESVFVDFGAVPENGWYRLCNGNYISADLVSENYDDIYTHCAEQYQDIIIVSIRNQFAYFSHFGQVWTSDVVTGHMTKSPTPTGLTKVMRKIRGVYLNGNQDTYVEYGVYFREGFLVHDAEKFPWRKTGFGGDIYKTNGSGGCVNTPTAFSEIVYRYSSVNVTYVLIMP